MRSRIYLVIALALVALALAAPASAVTVNGVEYILLSKSDMLMEQSAKCTNPPSPGQQTCMYIAGNIGVSDTNGRLRMGANNIISNGVDASAVANNLVLATNDDIDICRYNVTSGASPAVVCGATQVPPAAPFALPIVANWTPSTGPLGTVTANNCVNAAQNITVNAGATLNLPPGCYRDVRVNAGGSLILTAGTYNMRTLRLLAGSNMQGGGQPATTVTVNSTFITEAGVQISDIRVQTPGTANFSVSEFISIGNGSNLTNVVLYAPSSAIHLHLGMTGSNIESVANFQTIEPIVITAPSPTGACGCFSSVTDGNNTVSISDGENLTAIQQFFLSTSCDVTTCTAPGCNAIPSANVTVLNNQQATINTTGVPAGTYKVVGKWSSGTYCNNTPVTAP